MGCVMIGGETRYSWESALQELLGSRLEHVLYCAAQPEKALEAFCTLERTGHDPICVGIGEGCAEAVRIAARLPAAGLIAIAAPFAGLWLRSGYRRALEEAFAVVCPTLLVQPTAGNVSAERAGKRLEHALTSVRHLDILYLPESNPENLWTTAKDSLDTAFRSFFDTLSEKKHLRNGIKCV